MSRSLWIVITILVLVSACAPVGTATPVSPIQNITNTPTATPTSTRTLIPIVTSTTSVTPLPTIPTFTPTFDVSTIVTVTPAPKAECPAITSKENQDLSFLDVIEEPWDVSERTKVYNKKQDDLANFLSKNDLSFFISYLDSISKRNGVNSRKIYSLQDVTNDGVPELIYLSAIFGCDQGTYKILLQFDPYIGGGVPFFEQIHDGNHNGVPEIIVNIYTGNHGGRWYDVYEWTGDSFDKILDSFIINADGGWKFQDLNSDGVQELIVTEGVNIWPPPLDIQLRNKNIYYTWNGQKYVKYNYDFDKPLYRFQALQDADRYTIVGKHNKALSLYNDAIIDTYLEWWSISRQAFYRKNLFTIGTPVVEPTPSPDLTEYPRLAAYAYYRIMLLHFIQNQETEATTTYNTLQQKFGNDSYGRPYVEMASAFWDAYQSTHTMYDGCAAAIDYAVKHPEILIPLGSDYHGSQSHTYVADDVCPFR
jgi:hypothetical protein